MTDPPESDLPRPAGDGAAVAGLLRRRLAGGPLWLTVGGTSMGGTIRGGERVRVVAADRPRRGEVWAFCLADATIVVHRYRRREGADLRFQGDARPGPEVVGQGMVIGRVDAVDRGDGRVERLDGWTRLAARIRLDAAAARRRIAGRLHRT